MMRSRTSVALVWGVLLGLPAPAPGQAPTPAGATTTDQQAVHDALRELRDRAIDALNTSDVDALLVLAHDEVVFTAMNSEVARGKDEVRAYFDRMMTGPDRIVESVTVTIEADTLTVIHGDDTGIAYGSSRDSYRLTDGLELEVDTRWTATLVLDGDRWLIAGFHSSANLFENPLIDRARGLLLWIGGLALLLGLGAGWMLGRRRAAARA